MLIKHCEMLFCSVSLCMHSSHAQIALRADLDSYIEEVCSQKESARLKLYQSP